MQIAKWLSAAALLVTAAGCYTSALGTAPGPDGTTVYVAGRRSNPAALWSCPAQKTGENCKLVQVERQK